MIYAFNLEWSELDEDLREAKIDEFIKINYENGDYRDEKEDITLDECLKDEGIRIQAERNIEAHFPVYF